MIQVQIGNVFALGKFTVDVKAVNRIVLVELSHDHFCFCIKFSAVFGCLPVLQVALVVKFASHVVTAVRHFVPESRSADNGIQNGIVGHFSLISPEQ